MESVTGRHGTEKRAEAEQAMAAQVVADLPDMGWPVLPARPATLDATDEELVRWYQAGRGGQTLKRAEQQQLRKLSLWRAAVISAELQARARLATLLWAARILEKGDGFDAIAAVCAEEYGVNIPPVPGPDLDRERLLDRRCAATHLVPDWLRVMKGVPKPKVEADEPPQREWFT